jgi:hypothetical protein
MGFDCDNHYSEIGAEYLSKYVAKIFNENKKK